VALQDVFDLAFARQIQHTGTRQMSGFRAQQRMQSWLTGRQKQSFVKCRIELMPISVHPKSIEQRKSGGNWGRPEKIDDGAFVRASVNGEQ
jgi:hypothetical protein